MFFLRRSSFSKPQKLFQVILRVIIRHDLRFHQSFTTTNTVTMQSCSITPSPPTYHHNSLIIFLHFLSSTLFDTQIDLTHHTGIQKTFSYLIKIDAVTTGLSYRHIIPRTLQNPHTNIGCRMRRGITGKPKIRKSRAIIGR